VPQPSRSILPLRVIRATACARLFPAPAGRAFSTARSKSRASDGFPVHRRFATLAAIVTMPFRILSLLLCLLVAGPMSTPAWALARPETRVGKIFSAPLKSAAADLDQTLDARWENPACGYDFASGVCKYLYCHADPVNRIDPSGMMDMIQLQAVMTKISGVAAYTGFRAILVLNRVTVIVFEAVTGNTVIIGGGGAVVALKQGTKMGGVSWPTWQSIGNLLKGSGNKVGTYKEVAKVLERGSGQQANHLNQAKAFTNIPYDEGVAAAMGGGTNLKGTQHWRFHDVLEAFWRPFRASGTKPTNTQYAKAMEEGLEAAGYAPEEVKALSKLAEESRVSFGYHDGPGGLQPEVPGAIPGM